MENSKKSRNPKKQVMHDGYKENFIDPQRKSLKVDLPELNSTLLHDVAPVGSNGTLNYIHYSILLSKSRRFPYYTATNIDGAQFVRIKRAEVFDSGRDEWQEDARAENYQLGQKLYDAPKSYFDRGHMSKREDPQWGANYEVARKAAQETFFFTNCVPQLAELNQRIWANLETYILAKQAVRNKLRINLFTGPVLSKSDPNFVTKVNNEVVQLPVLFWKVIYYSNDGKALSRVAFIMGQEDLMIDRGIAIPKVGTRVLDAFFVPAKNYFMDYEDAETYQVNIKTIQTLTGMTFPKANDPYKDNRPIKLIKKVAQVTGKKKLLNAVVNQYLTVPDFRIPNIKL